MFRQSKYSKRNRNTSVYAWDLQMFSKYYSLKVKEIKYFSYIKVYCFKYTSRFLL